MKQILVGVLSFIVGVVCVGILYFSLFTYNADKVKSHFNERESEIVDSTVELPEAVDVTNSSLTDIVKSPDEVKETIEGETMGYDHLFNAKYVTDNAVLESVERIKKDNAPEEVFNLKEEIEEYIIPVREQEMNNGIAESKSIVNRIVSLAYKNPNLTLYDIMLEIGNSPSALDKYGIKDPNADVGKVEDDEADVEDEE